MAQKLTKSLIDRTTATDRDIILWDTQLKRFGIRVKPSGIKTYMIQYRREDGLSRRLTVGKHGDPWTVTRARKRAADLLIEVDAGGDPVGEKKAERQAARAGTVADLAEKYMTEIAAATKKPRSVAEDQRNLDKHLLPTFGKKKLAAVSAVQVRAFMHDMRGRPGVANRALALLSHMFNMAPELGMLDEPANPARGVKKYKFKDRERYLSDDELERLGDALTEFESGRPDLAAAVAAVRLLTFTGCRRNEILDLRWTDVDFKDKCLRLPDSKTGAKDVHLAAPALEVLSNIKRLENNPYVIVGRKPGTRLVGLNHIWQRIRASADLSDVRLHDLRHSYASIAVGLGMGLPIVGKLLGHKVAATTERYIHVPKDPAQRAAERIGAKIAGAMSGQPSGDVTPLKKA